MYVKMLKLQHVLKWTYRLFGMNYRVATLSTLSLTVSGIILPSLKVIGQFLQAKINEKDLTVSDGRKDVQKDIWTYRWTD